MLPDATYSEIWNGVETAFPVVQDVFATIWLRYPFGIYFGFAVGLILTGTLIKAVWKYA